MCASLKWQHDEWPQVLEYGDSFLTEFNSRVFKCLQMNFFHIATFSNATFGKSSLQTGGWRNCWFWYQSVTGLISPMLIPNTDTSYSKCQWNELNESWIILWFCQNCNKSMNSIPILTLVLIISIFRLIRPALILTKHHNIAVATAVNTHTQKKRTLQMVKCCHK